MEFNVIFCTTNSLDNAKKIANMLIDKKLAACVNIIPQIFSVYSWENKTVNDEEILLIIKTRKELFENVKIEIIKNHPYSVPEIISLPIEKGYDKYLNWIESSTVSK